ncbi:MAG: hypothetical protein QW607_04445 [Desulfurococcaceae archaeon]
MVVELKAELRELKTRDEILFAKTCIKLYGMPLDRFMNKGRFFGLIRDGKICAVAYLHEPYIYKTMFRYFMIPEKNSYFLRRIATCCPGEHLITLLQLLFEKLRSEGKECIVTFGLPDHSNYIYKETGFTEIGRTRRGNPIFIKKLQ